MQRCVVHLTILVCLIKLAAAQDSVLGQRYAAAQRTLTAGDYGQAEAQFGQLAHNYPQVAEIHANLGLVYFQERKFTQAIQELRRTLELKPSLSNSEYILSMSLSELGHYADALPGLQKGFHAADQEIKRMCGLQLERAYTGLGQDTKAVETALEMNRLFPNDPEVLYHNARIFGNFAFLSVQRLGQVAPNSVWKHQALAEAYESQGAYGSAITEYRQVLGIDPQRLGIHYRLGRTLLTRAQETNSGEDREPAIREFEQELRLDPLDASAAYEIGEVHRSAGEFEDAQKYFEMALKNYADFEEAHLGISAVLIEGGNPSAALRHLQKAIALNAHNEVSWYRLARVERSLGNMEEAQNALARFHQLHNEKNPEQGKGAKSPLFSGNDVTKQTIDANEGRSGPP